MKDFGHDMILEVGKNIKLYFEIRTAVAKKRAELKANARHNRDPTPAEAQKAVDEVEFVKLERGDLILYPERWIDAVKTVYNSMGKEDRMFFEHAFWKRETHEQKIQKTYVAKDTYYRKRQRMILIVAIAAASRGLIRFKGEEDDKH